MHDVYSRELGPKGKQKFFEKNPTLIGVVGGYAFYECPIHGDESSLYAVNSSEDSWGRTWFHEVPDIEDIYTVAAA